MYYSNEENRLISTEELKSEYSIMLAAGNIPATETFKEYLENCMWYNNGDLTRVNK